LYSTCGLSFFVFLAAAVLSLPKQFALIAIGVLMHQQDEDANNGAQPPILAALLAQSLTRMDQAIPIAVTKS
jgi:hypothetical protein